MNGNTERRAAPIELKHEADFELGFITVRPSASEVVVDGAAERVEPRVMQTLVALVQAGGEVVSRDELMARCWEGAVVSDDAVTRAVGQVRRLSRQAPGSFTLQTIAKIGYRLIPAAAAGVPQGAIPRRATESLSRPAKFGRPLGLLAVVGVALVAALVVVQPTVGPPPALRAPSGPLGDLGTINADANDRYLRATRLLEAGGRDNTLRAEELLRDALEIDPEFHAAKESLAIAVLSAAAFEPARADAAHAEFAELLESEAVDTPLAWRGHVMRGFQHVFAGDWLAAERALANARDGAPADAQGPVAALQTRLGRSAEHAALARSIPRRAAMARALG
jgi:DNA-binding winged helix-turn-helix (wHTH) protein